MQQRQRKQVSALKNKQTTRTDLGHHKTTHRKQTAVMWTYHPSVVYRHHFTHPENGVSKGNKNLKKIFKTSINGNDHIAL